MRLSKVWTTLCIDNLDGRALPSLGGAISRNWEGFCYGLGLDIDIPDAKLSSNGDFPVLFPEAASAFKSHPVEDYLIDLPNWENRPVDVRNPNSC